jgi:hypothetical protein
MSTDVAEVTGGMGDVMSYYARVAEEPISNAPDSQMENTYQLQITCGDNISDTLGSRSSDRNHIRSGTKE